MAPDVTVIVPTRNRMRILARTLASILAQRDVAFEVLVVDEGSSDATPAFLAGCGDPRLRTIRHDEPRMLPGARNAGLAQATGRWVAFCDDDDLWAPDKLRAQLDTVQETGWRWSVTGVVLIDVDERVIGHGRAVGGDLADRLRIGNIIPGGGSAVMAETELVRELGGFDESLRASEDYDLWVRLGMRSPLAAVDRPLAAYRVWPRSMSSDTVRQRTAHDEVVRRYRSEGTAPTETRAVDQAFRQYLARAHLRSGDRWRGFLDYGDIALRYRAPSQALHAMGALLAPGWTERWRAHRELAEVPVAWRSQGEAWLKDNRSLIATGV